MEIERTYTLFSIETNGDRFFAVRYEEPLFCFSDTCPKRLVEKAVEAIELYKELNDA